MKLYVMRHGPAEDHSATGRDEDRALTPSGRDRVRSVARLLVQQEETPLRLITSRLVRAVETGDIVVASLKATGAALTPELARELAPAGKGIDLVRRLQADGADRVMIVGHEPDLSALVERLLGDPLSLAMEKAMVVALEVGSGPAVSLRFVVEPRSLEILHDGRR